MKTLLRYVGRAATMSSTSFFLEASLERPAGLTLITYGEAAMRAVEDKRSSPKSSF